jgi:hypothetical protein
MLVTIWESKQLWPYKRWMKRGRPTHVHALTKVRGLQDIPPFLHTLHLFDNKIKFGSYLLNVLPNTLTFLNLGNYDTAPLPDHVLPPSLTRLHTSYHSWPLPPLPFSLQVLHLGSSIVLTCKSDIPATTSLYLDTAPLTPFGPSFLNQVQTLHINGYWFNPANIVLPTSLTKLHLPDAYNDSIPDGFLPASLKILKFGCQFNKQIWPNDLPHSLTVLHFGYCFNQPITLNMLPNSITDLQFGCYFTQHLNYLPHALTCLRLHAAYNLHVPDGIQKVIQSCQERIYIQEPISQFWYNCDCIS